MFYFNGLILTADFLSKTPHVQICFPIQSHFIIKRYHNTGFYCPEKIIGKIIV